MKKFVSLMFCIVLAAIVIGCNSEVPGGYVGMVKTPGGFDGDTLSPGLHGCWGRDTMYLIQASDTQMNAPISQLCADNVNFKFDIGVLFAVNRENTKAIKGAFLNVTPEGNVGSSPAITSAQLYKTYVQPQVDQQARKVISRYATSEIVENRGKIAAEIDAGVRSAFKDSLINIKMVTMNNDDYPDFITKAQEQKVGRRVEIETERAEQEKRIIVAENKLRIAQIDYEVQLMEAATTADANKVIGSSITDGYLAWWQLKVMSEAARGPNNWGLIPYSDFVNQRAGINRLSSAGIVDAELLKRIETAKEHAAQVPAPAKTASPVAKPAEKSPVK